MSIGRRSPRKRPRNDLDEFLDQVESGLFCVTKADKRCLLRDLKAHVKELTTDPKTADRFEGMYQISMDQLREEIGDPDTIASMYIDSVGKKVPSLGLRIYLVIMSAFFLIGVYIGLIRYHTGIQPDIDQSSWLVNSGFGLAICGATAFGILTYISYNFQRFHRYIGYLIVISILFSFPLSIYLSRVLTRTIQENTAVILQNWYGLMFLIDIAILTIIGLWIYLKHYQVLGIKPTQAF